MDFTQSYPIRSNSESSTTIYDSAPEYQLDFKSHWPNNMYSTQQFDGSKKPQLPRRSIDENGKNCNLRMYSTKQSISMENMTNQPKKETLWQSMFRSATNLLSEHFTRGTGSIIKNWSSMNHPLSVTVVSPDFYKSLQQGKDHQLVNPPEGFFSAKTWSKDSRSSDEALPNILYSNEIISDSVKENNSDPNDSDRRWKEYKNLYVDFTETQKDLNEDKKTVNIVNNSGCNIEVLESHFNFVVDDEKDVDKSTNFGHVLDVNNDPVILEKLAISEKKSEELQEQSENQSSEFKENSPVMPVSMLLTNTYNKIANSIADMAQRRIRSPKSQSASLICKRTRVSRKLRSKKRHRVLSSRVYGRAKLQLLRSGTKHLLRQNREAEDTNSNTGSWEDIKDNMEDIDVCDFAGREPGCNYNSVAVQDVSLENIESKDVDSFSARDSIPSVENNEDTDFEISFEENAVEPRQRLLSQSSVDSDDSYCIVFEDAGNEVVNENHGGNNVDIADEDNEYDNEVDLNEDSDDDGNLESEDDQDFAEDLTNADNGNVDPVKRMNRTRVRFDPEPTVHHMIQWNFAYRAARTGPWEMMARDRERFSNRIRNYSEVLDPILSNQHRLRIWQERFKE